MEFKSLNQIFENRIFRIPDYQRGYAWRSDVEVLDFWNDLLNLHNRQFHFTGSLTLQEITGNELENSLHYDKWICDEVGYKAWSIIDGQQRLTTAIILLQSICKFLSTCQPDDGFMHSTVSKTIENIQEKFIGIENYEQCVKTYIFGYSNNDVSNNYLRRHIFNDISVTSSEDSYYTLNIKNAKEFFNKSIENLYQNDGMSAIESLYKKLTQQLKFQLIEVKQTDDFNIFVAFETINNRGRQLSNLEKLKNRLIYLTTLYEKPDSPFLTSQTPIRDHINKGWAEIYRQLGRNVKKSSTGKVFVLDDDEFLKTHWILYFQYSRKTSQDYIKFLLGNQFTTKNVLSNQTEVDSLSETIHDEDIDNDEYSGEPEANTPSNSSNSPKLTLWDIHAYVTDLKNTAKAWYYTWFPQDANDELNGDEKLWMERINHLGIAYFRPLITAVFYERLANKIASEKVVELLQTIERFIFINFRLQDKRSHYGSSEFSIAAKEIHKGNQTVENIIDLLKTRIENSFVTDGTIKTQNVQGMVEKLFEQKK